MLSRATKRTRVVATEPDKKMDPLDESNFFSIKRQRRMGAGRDQFEEFKQYNDTKVWALSKEQKMKAISAFCSMLHAHVVDIHERKGDENAIFEKLERDFEDGFALGVDNIIHLDVIHPILEDDDIESARVYWQSILEKPRSIDVKLEQAAKRGDWKAFQVLKTRVVDQKWLIAIRYAECKEDVQALQEMLPWQDMHREILQAMVHYHLMSKVDPGWFMEFANLFMSQLKPVKHVEDEAILTTHYLESRLQCLEENDAKRHKALATTIEKFKGFLRMDALVKL